MHLPSRLGAGTLLSAVVLAPWPAAFAADLHPLDPMAPAGVVSTANIFEQVVPLLERESPAPSFLDDAAESSSAAEASSNMPDDHGGMNHDAMGHTAPAAEAQQ